MCVEIVIAHGTPLITVRIQHLKTAGLAGAGYKTNKAVATSFAAGLPL
jgi:hypothetical protein